MKLPNLLNLRWAWVGAVMGLPLAWSVAHAQYSRSAYDLSGNLVVQTNDVAGLPEIVGGPASQIVAPGQTASFSVVAKDSTGLGYQWQFYGTNLSGATGDTLLRTNVSAANEGPYAVVLSNGSGSITSAPALLMIDSDRDGLPDSWERTYFTNLNQIISGDWDGDGVSNGDEFLDGTNPTNNASAFFHLKVGNNGGVVEISPLKLKYTNGEIVTLTATAIAPGIFRGFLGDVNTTNNPLTLVMNTNKNIFAHMGASYDFVFINNSGGDWLARSNWSPNFLPGPSDNAFINSQTVTNNGLVEVRGLYLGVAGASPNLSGSGTIIVHSNGVWTSGAMTGTGRTIINSNATFTITNTSTVFLDTRTLENAGRVLWTGADSFNIQASGGVITNRAGALFEVRNNGGFSPFPGNGRFDNAGTLRKTNGSGTTTFVVNTSFGTAFSFNNYGTTEVQTGTLLCNAPCVNNGATTLSPGTTLRLAGGGSASGTFSNPASALVDWAGNSSTFTLSPGAMLDGSGHYKVSGGIVTLNTDVVVQTLDLLATLNGNGWLTVNNALNWTSGSMTGSGRTIIAPGATNFINNTSTVFLDTRTLENAGTVLWTGGDSFNLQASGAVITNRPGALFDVRNNANIYPFPGNGRFDNAGLLRKSAGSGTTTFAVNTSFGTVFPFNNYGTTEIQTGTLLCSATFVNNGAITLSPGTTFRMSAGGSTSGTLTNPAGALVDWIGSSTFTVSPGALLSGGGLYRVGGSSTLTLNTNLAVQNLDLAATLNGSGWLTVSNVMNWTAGNMSGSGRTIIAPGATNYLNNVSTLFLDTRTFENGGTVLWTGTGGFSIQASGAVITNRAGALFEVRNNNSFYPFPGNGRFDNAGTLRKAASTGNTTFDSNFSFGTVFPLNNYGTLDIRSGIVFVSVGGYTPSSTSLLKCALGGTTPGTGYSRLSAAGNVTVTLNGALAVDLLPGFSPASNDVFTVFTAGTRNGSFANFSYPSNRVAMTLNNTANSVVLQVTNVFAVPTPLLLTPQLAGSNVMLTWTATSNVTYRLENNADAASTNWTAIPGDVTTSSNTASKLDPLTLSNRFYRVRVLP